MSLLKENTIYQDQENKNLFYFFYKGTPGTFYAAEDTTITQGTSDYETYFTFSTNGSSLRELADKKDTEMTSIISNFLKAIHNTKDNPYEISDEKYEQLKTERIRKNEEIEKNKAAEKKEKKENEENILKDDDKYFEEIKKRWASMMKHGISTKKKEKNGVITYEVLHGDDNISTQDEFFDFLVLLQKRLDLINNDKITRKTNGYYQVGLTVRRPIKNEKIGFCTVDDFAVTDQQWQQRLNQYPKWELKKQSNLLAKIANERQCMSTSNRLVKFLGFNSKLAPIEAVPVDARLAVAAARYEPVNAGLAKAVPVDAGLAEAEAVPVNAGGRKSRRHNKSKRNQKSKRSRKSKRRKHHKTRK
jgi:hypothetical protein